MLVNLNTHVLPHYKLVMRTRADGDNRSEVGIQLNPPQFHP